MLPFRVSAWLQKMPQAPRQKVTASLGLEQVIGRPDLL